MGSATRRVLAVGFLLLFCVTAVLGRSRGPLQRISIRVYDYANTPDRTLRSAEHELARIFGEVDAGVDVVVCFRDGKILDSTCNLPARPSELFINIVGKVPRGFSRFKLSRGSCGYSLLTEDPRENRRATVFRECMERISNDTGISPSVVLAHLVAHEIAHLLLATNEHSADGLFRAKLGPEEWTRAGNSRLGFIPEDVARLRAAVAYRFRPPDAVELARRTPPAPAARPH